MCVTWLAGPRPGAGLTLIIGQFPELVIGNVDQAATIPRWAAIWEMRGFGNLANSA
jgi:hypothetical protein